MIAKETSTRFRELDKTMKSERLGKGNMGTHPRPPYSGPPPDWPSSIRVARRRRFALFRATHCVPLHHDDDLIVLRIDVFRNLQVRFSLLRLKHIFNPSQED